MKGTRNVGILVIVALLLILGVWSCNGYNGLVKKRNAVDNAWAQVDNQYQRRADLIDNLVNTVKGQVKAENQTLVQVIEARNQARAGFSGFNKLTGDSLTQEKIDQYQRAFSEYQRQTQLFISVVSEQYPDLKSAQAFSELRTEMAGTENRLATARMDFNNSVTSFKNASQTFPGNILASIFGIKAKDLFIASPGADKKPEVPSDFMK
jgi:LemA protein